MEYPLHIPHPDSFFADADHDEEEQRQTLCALLGQNAWPMHAPGLRKRMRETDDAVRRACAG